MVMTASYVEREDQMMKGGTKGDSCGELKTPTLPAGRERERTLKNQERKKILEASVIGARFSSEFY